MTKPDMQPARLKRTPGPATATVGLIADIHANLPALAAVLRHAAARNIRRFWNAGDSVGYGPFPDEVVRALRAPDIISIAGNYDLKALKIGRGAAAGKKPQKRRHPDKQLAFEWAYQNLTRASRARLAQLPPERRMRRHGRRILLTHGSPASNKEYVDGDTPLQRLHELAGRARADIVVCGHAHRQFKRKVAGVWFINPGSVGRPDDGDPRAGYAALQFTTRGLRIRHHRVAYDLAPVRAALRRHRLPKTFDRMLTKGLDFDRATSNEW